MRQSAVVAYFGAHYSKSLIWNFFNTFFLFFAIYGLGINPIHAGIIALAFAATDAIFDLPVSLFLQRSAKLTNGMAKFVSFATPLCCLFLCLAFTKFDSLGAPLSIALCVAAGFAFRLAFTFIDVPLNSSIGRISYNSKARNGVAGWRSIGSAGAVVSLAVLLSLLAEENDKILADRLWQIAALISAAACVIIIPSFHAVDASAREKEKPQTDFHISETARLVLGNVTKNFGVLFAINFASLLLVGQFFRAVIFIVEKQPDSTPSFSEALILITVVSAVTVAPWMALASRLEKNQAAIILNICLLLAVLSFGVLSSSLVGILIFFVLFGSLHHWNTFIWAILPDTTDEVSKNAGNALHTPIIGIFAAFGKLTIGLGNLLGGWLLQISGFPDSPDFDAYITYVTGVTAFGCVACVLLYSRYRLTHAKYLEIPATLLKDHPQDDGSTSKPRADK